MITKIDHDLRKSLRISIIEFCLMDYIHKIKLDTTAAGIGNWLEISELEAWPLIESLKKAGWLEVGARSGKCSPTSKWKQAVKPAPKPQPGETTISYKLRLIVMEFNELYSWNKFHDYRNAHEIIEKLTAVLRVKHQRDPSEHEILDLFRFILANLPVFYADKWDMEVLNKKLNAIMLKIRENKRSGGKIIDSAKAIQQASDSFVPKTNFD